MLLTRPAGVLLLLLLLLLVLVVVVVVVVVAAPKRTEFLLLLWVFDGFNWQLLRLDGAGGMISVRTIVVAAAAAAAVVVVVLRLGFRPRRRPLLLTLATEPRR